jgi:hypothetical protein
MRGKKEKEKPWKKLSHNWNAAPPIHSGFHWKIPSFPRRFFFSFFFLGHRFSLQVYFRNLNIKSQRKIRFFVCVCFLFGNVVLIHGLMECEATQYVQRQQYKKRSRGIKHGANSSEIKSKER